MEYWLGITKLSSRKGILTITSEDGFYFIIKLKEGEKFLYNKCLDKLNLEVENLTIIKSKGTGQKQSIMGFASFMSNIGLLLKKHIINKKIKKYELNDFYLNIFNVIKQILG